MPWLSNAAAALHAAVGCVVAALHAAVGYAAVGLLCGGAVGCAGGLALESPGNHLPALTIVFTLLGLTAGAVLGMSAAVVLAARRRVRG